MTGSREAILERVRSAIADGTSPEAAPRAYRATGELGPEARIELLCARLGDYRAEVRRVRDADLPAAIAAAFEQQGASRVGIPAGIPAHWRPAGLRRVNNLH